ncbi:MAG: HAD family hydrolase [Erysipelotrichaceae bacterium]|nr:HAD family hydrolase [Erysipelotrichaceae bacterium]
MNMKTDAVIFDIDGTLTNSTRAIIASWNRHLASLSCPHRLLDEETAGSLMGKTMDDWAVAVLPDLPLAEAREITEVMEQKENEEIRTSGTDLYPFVRETFELLSHDYDLFILSNCGKGYIEAVMAYAGIEEYVKGHICFGDNGLDKPDNLKKMVTDYQLGHPVYVGDTQRDQECCEIAGIPFIFVSWGFGDVPDALYRCDDMKDLPEVIRSLG